MIRRIDWALLGLVRAMRPPQGAHPAPTCAAAELFRGMGELYPRWAAEQPDSLKIGLACSLNGGVARKLLQEFRRSQPQVNLVVCDVDEPSLIEGLNTGRLDAAIGPRALAQPTWSTLELCHERLIAVLPERHALAAGNDVGAAQLREELILLPGKESGDRAFRWAIIDALGGSPLAFEHCPVQRDTLFDLVALELGVTICSGAPCGAFFPGISLRPIGGTTGDIAYGLFWSASAEAPALDAFVATAMLVSGVGGIHE